jgi:proliferating cell nuclear antigen
VKLLDINEDFLEIPETYKEYIDTSISSVDFQKLVRDMSNIGSEIVITRKGQLIEFNCEGDFASKKTQIETNENVKNGSSGTFSLKYISLFTKATILCPLVQIIQEGDDSPIIFKYSVANLGTLCFYLAPLNT